MLCTAPDPAGRPPSALQFQVDCRLVTGESYPVIFFLLDLFPSSCCCMPPKVWYISYYLRRRTTTKNEDNFKQQQQQQLDHYGKVSYVSYVRYHNMYHTFLSGTWYLKGKVLLPLPYLWYSLTAYLGAVVSEEEEGAGIKNNPPPKKLLSQGSMIEEGKVACSSPTTGIPVFQSNMHV